MRDDDTVPCREATMRIAILPSAYQPSIGGVEELSRQLAIAYARRGHHVIVLTNRWPRTLPRHEILDGIDVYRIPFRTRHASLRGRVSYALTRRRIEHELQRVLEQHQIDVMHVQCVSSNAEYAMRMRKRMPLRLVVTTQGELTMDAAHSFERDPIMIDIMSRALVTADAVTACSGKTLRDAERFLHRSLPHAHVVRNGAHVASFDDAEPLDLGVPYVLAIGRLVPQKGFDLLLDAWSAVERDAPDTVLVVAGSGPDDAALRARVEALGLGSRVHFFGPADRETVPRLFTGATAVVVPSRADEGLPLVAVEALAAGKPLVVTRTGGVEEAVEQGVSAIVVERGDAAGLAHALRRLLTGEVRLCETAAREAARSLDWDVLAGQYLEVLGG